MEIIHDNRKEFINQYLCKKISNAAIKKYFIEKDFESCIFYILREYYPKTFRTKNIHDYVDKLNKLYLQKYYKYNKKNYNQIILDIGIIIKFKQEGLDKIENFYKNTDNILNVFDNLEDFFSGKTYRGSQVYPKYN